MIGPLLALAFGAGMLAPVNPCGFAVLPAFLAYAVDTGDGQADARPGALSRLAGGLRAGGHPLRRPSQQAGLHLLGLHLGFLADLGCSAHG